MPSVYLLDALALALTVAWILTISHRRVNHHPPGPKGYPVVGNFDCVDKIFDISFVNRLAAQYGDIVHVKVLDQHMVYLNSVQAMVDLLQKRSNNYSDRAQTVMARDLVGWDWVVGTMNLGDRWKRHRRTFERPFRESHVHVFWDVQMESAQHLLADLYKSPKDFMAYIRLAAARATLKITYGIDVKDMENPFVALSERGNEVMARGADFFLVNLIPALKWLPSWFPGAGFKKTAKRWRVTLSQMREAPFEASQMIPETEYPTFISQLMCELDQDLNEDVEVIKNTAGQAYIGGVDSASATLATFVRALTLFPSAQKKAQEELDAVCPGRLPTFDDRKSLPQLEALVREVLRWHPVAPLGVPHKSVMDDIYEGYLIPARSIVFSNIGYIFNNEEMFPDPLVFDPDRFLKDGWNVDIIDPREIAFGFGKRICPGRFLADSFLWICIASILAVYDIAPAPGADQEGLCRDDVFTKVGFFSPPLPFECSIQPRGDAAKKLFSTHSGSEPKLDSNN